MSTQRLPPGPGYPAPPVEHNTQPLGPLRRYTRRRYMLFHLGFTLRLVGRCLADPRVGAGRKLIFLGVLGFLMMALLVPETGADLIGLFVPIFDLFGIPFEGVVDWGFFVFALGWLIGIFPPDVLRRHIQELQGSPWFAPQSQQLPPPPPRQLPPPRR
jgi:hypothetical protein